MTAPLRASTVERERAVAARAWAEGLLERGRCVEEVSAAQSAALFETICQSAARAHARYEMRVAVVGCAAAFLAGIWVASHGLGRESPRELQPLAATRATPEDVAAAHRSPSYSAAWPLATSEMSSSVPGDATASAAAAVLPSGARFETVGLPGVGLVEVLGPSTPRVLELTAERQIQIDQGLLRAQIARQDPLRPVVVVTPQVRVVVVGTRFDLSANSQATRVELFEGHVRVESDFGSVELSAGESVGSDDARLRPPRPESASSAPADGGLTRALPAARVARGGGTISQARTGAAEADCGEFVALRERRACLLRQAQGDSLTAENALHALALLVRDETHEPERAVEYWYQYQARFPLGALAPEVGQELFQTLLALGRAPAAIEEAARFEERFADDSRAPRVALTRARLLCEEAGEREAGRAILERLSVCPEPQVRAKAEELRAACLGPSVVPAGAGALVPREVRPGAPPGD